MKSYRHLAPHLFNVPLLMDPRKLDAIIAGLGSRLLSTDLDHAPVELTGQPLPADLFTTRRGTWTYQREEGAFYATQNGVAVLDIHGALAHRNMMTADSNAVLGYQQIARNLDMALADDSVHTILLDVDSPGGEVAGAFELAEQIRAADARKPVYAVADSLAASAGYLIISGARQIAVAPTGYVGSIGVVMTHVDLSRKLANEGLSVTHIFAGAHKVDGSPYRPLPETTRERFQSEIDSLYGQFVATVASARRLDPSAVRATEAAVFRAQAAVDARLADRIATPDTLIAELAAQRPRSFPGGQPARATVSSGDTRMTTDTNQAGASTQPAAITEADLDAAQKLGAETERARIFAILDSQAAQDRPQAALALARKPAIDAATAADVLAALPSEVLTLEASETKPGPSEFSRHMAALGNPRVGLDDEASPELSAGTLWGRIVARYQH